MAAEETQPKPAEVLAENVGFLLSKLGFECHRQCIQALDPVGLHPPHAGLLRCVAAAEGQSQQALADALAIPPSRIVAIVDDLEEKGLVERRLNPADRRARALFLTTKGRRVLAQATDRMAKIEEELCAPLTAAERDRLRDLLRKIASEREIPIGVHPGMLLG